MIDLTNLSNEFLIMIGSILFLMTFIQSSLIAQRVYSNTKVIKKYTNADKIQRFKDRIDTIAHKLDELVDGLNNMQDITEEEIEKTKVKFDDFNYKMKEIFEKIDGMNYNQLSKLVLRLSDRIKIIEQNYDEYVPDLDHVDEYTEKIIDTEKEDMKRENTSLKKQVKKLNERLEVFTSSPKTLRNGKTY